MNIPQVATQRPIWTLTEGHEQVTDGPQQHSLINLIPEKLCPLQMPKSAYFRTTLHSLKERGEGVNSETSPLAEGVRNQ